MNHKVDLQPAYVLHTRDYRDTSLLVDFLSLDYGIVRAVARGVRGKRSGRRALLQSLQPILISFAGKGELKSLSHFESAAPAFILDGDRLFSAMYVNELICRLLQTYEAHPQIYRLYQTTMLSLMHRHAIEGVLRRFEFRLLMELGYAPDMAHDAIHGEYLDSERDYEFDCQRGFIPVATGQNDAQAAVYHGSAVISLGQALMQEMDHDFCSSLLQTAKRFTRQALRPHLGNKPLNSRQLFITRSVPATACLPPDSNKG